jgi:hypothetical protein
MRRKSTFGCLNFAALAACLAGIGAPPHAGPAQLSETHNHQCRSGFSKLLRVFAVAILIAPFAIASSTNANANILACFKALAPLDEAKKAAEVSAKAAACMSQASGDPMMAMTIAALSAGAVSGKFSGVDQCNAMVDGAVGKLIAEALLTILPDGAAKDQLTQFVQGKSAFTLKEILNGIDFLKPVLGYIECGCDVAGAPGDYAAIAKEYADKISECGSFFGDAGHWFIDGAGSVAGDVAGVFNHGGGATEYDTCGPSYVANDIWTKTVIHAYDGKNICQFYCSKGSYLLEKTEAGNKLYECIAKCPDAEKTHDDLCSYSTYTSGGGVCNNTSSVSCCTPGHKVVEWGVCSPACTPGAEYWNTVDNKCEICSAGTKSNGADPCIPCANNGYVSLSQYAGQKGACHTTSIAN